ncbi:MAG TPA: pantoate--beta-alanine ligase [Rhizomicrobium sp.]
MDSPKIADSARALREILRGWQGRRIALVPTMGALHEGHLSLVRAARAQSDKIIVSIFVNPAQFAPNEDFAAYPRDLPGDAQKLAGADLIFAPGVEDMYPKGFATGMTVGGPAQGLESDFRPHFFGGVALVVAKLLIAAAPHVAIFGEKDYQQLLVVRSMVRDLGLPVEIVGVPTLREADGLAMSSRNAYLSADERKVAGKMNVVLANAVARLRAGAAIAAVEAEASAALKEAGFDTVDYVAVRDAENLQAIQIIAAPARILAAARVGRTRLIDNMPV